MMAERFIFLDTSAIISLNDTEDSNHERAVKIFNRLNRSGKLITSNYIFAEIATVLRLKIGNQKALPILDDLRNSEVDIIWVDPELEARAYEILKKIPSKNVSFVDAVSFVVMKNRGIKMAFTFDQHFKTQGFKLLGE